MRLSAAVKREPSGRRKLKGYEEERESRNQQLTIWGHGLRGAAEPTTRAGKNITKTSKARARTGAPGRRFGVIAEPQAGTHFGVGDADSAGYDNLTTRREGSAALASRAGVVGQGHGGFSTYQMADSIEALTTTKGRIWSKKNRRGENKRGRSVSPQSKN